MAVNRGKQFEQIIETCLIKTRGVSIDRIHDQTNGFKGSSNICDYIVYRYPYQYYFECKSVHGNTLSIFGTTEKHKYGNITNKQWEGLKEKAKIAGVLAGVICWWVDKDITRFIPIQVLEYARAIGNKSIRYDDFVSSIIDLEGKKKRVFFDYDMDKFLREATRWVM